MCTSSRGRSRSAALIIRIMFSMVKWRAPIQWALDLRISGHMMNLISMGRGRFLKMFFVRPDLKYVKCPSTCHLRHDRRGNQNLVSEVTVSHTRVASFLFTGVWTLRRVESSHTSEEQRVRVSRGQQDTRKETTAEDGSNSLSACCAEGFCSSLVLYIYNKAVTAECSSCTSVSFRIGPGYYYVATSPKD